MKTELLDLFIRIAQAGREAGLYVPACDWMEPADQEQIHAHRASSMGAFGDFYLRADSAQRYDQTLMRLHHRALAEHYLTAYMEARREAGMEVANV